MDGNLFKKIILNMGIIVANDTASKIVVIKIPRKIIQNLFISFFVKMFFQIHRHILNVYLIYMDHHQM